MQVRFVIQGRVQGVWFRASVKEQADELGMKGYAKNRADGSVEVVAQGSESQVEQLRKYCVKGPDMARVDKITAEVMSEEVLSRFEVL